MRRHDLRESSGRIVVQAFCILATIFVLTASSVAAKWRRLDNNELITSAIAIAIVDVPDPAKEKADNKPGVTVKVEQVIKGQLPETLLVYPGRGNGELCTPYANLQAGKHLIFLYMANDGKMMVLNGGFGFRKISSDKVSWFEDDGSPEHNVSLADKIKVIKSTLGQAAPGLKK